MSELDPTKRWLTWTVYATPLMTPGPTTALGLSIRLSMFELRETGQAQGRSGGHQGSSVDRPCQPSFCWIKFWHVWNPLPQSIRLRLSVLVRYWAG